MISDRPAHRRRSAGGLLPFVFFLILIFPMFSQAVGGGFPEYQVKAEMLFRIAEFVDWPSDSFFSPPRAFVIGIAGRDPFGAYLTNKARARKIHGTEVEIRKFGPDDSPETFHLVFIAREERGELASILKKIGNRPILSVADGESFSSEGVHIGFLLVDGRVRFNVNLDTATRSGLTIPAGLLRLAARVFKEGRR